LLGEVGESVRTAQAILGRSDLETTLNTYLHAIADSQRCAVVRVERVVFPDERLGSLGSPRKETDVV